jgi:integrase
MREGRLLKEQQSRVPTFGEYAEGWWEPGKCKYLEKRMGRIALTAGYIFHARRKMEMFLIPYFGKMRLDRITDEEIDTWLVTFTKRERRISGNKIAKSTEIAPPAKELKASYANEVFQILYLMLGQAVKRHIIPFNPADNVEKLVIQKKEVKILTGEEFKELSKPKPKALPLAEGDRFDKKGMSVELARIANFLAACTGMRIGEVMGLRGEFVFSDYIRVAGQFGAGGYGPTKTRTGRNIPLAAEIIRVLKYLVTLNGDGYVFSTDGGATPITRYYFNKYLTGALAAIGIDAEEKKKRNLTPHAWRYFLNTNLRARGVPDAKVQAITGHLAQESTERYTSFYTEQFSEVLEFQNTLVFGDGRGAGRNGVSGGDRAESEPNGERGLIRAGGISLEAD